MALDLTPQQRLDLDRQLNENRRTGNLEVTIYFTPQQLDVIRARFPRCEETFIRCDGRCVEDYRLSFQVDDRGRIIPPVPPSPSP